MIPRYAVILTHNRPDDLQRCVDSVVNQVDQVFVIDNASEPPVRPDPDRYTLWRDDLQPPNLSIMWNEAWHHIREAMECLGIKRWNVAMLCDDVIVPSEWVNVTAIALRELDVTVTATHPITPVTAPIIKRAPDHDIMNRMPGPAFMIAGERGLAANEDLHWWWGDTDLDFQARLDKGMAIVPGPTVTNLKPGEWTNAKPELGARAGVDAENFVKRWGFRPW